MTDTAQQERVAAIATRIAHSVRNHAHAEKVEYFEVSDLEHEWRCLECAEVVASAKVRRRDAKADSLRSFRGSYDSAPRFRQNDADDALGLWYSNHVDELLDIALGTDGELERVAKAIFEAHDTTGGHDPYDCCLDDEESMLCARAALDSLRSGRA